MGVSVSTELCRDPGLQVLEGSHLSETTRKFDLRAEAELRTLEQRSSAHVALTAKKTAKPADYCARSRTTVESRR